MVENCKLGVMILGLVTFLSSGPAFAKVDREKLMTEAGVYGTFAVFKVDGAWWKLDKATRDPAAAEVKSLVQKYEDKVITDLYLLRGLSEQADFFVRVHATELLYTQNFLTDFMATTLGKYLTNTETYNGLTKKANYVPGFPDDLKAKLKTPPDPGSKPYAIVIPIRKSADWWLLDQEARTDLMKEHTEPTVAYLKTVKRKLYHSSGLDDFDFLTYFETAKLDDFNNLLIGLQQVEEYRYTEPFGRPLLLGTFRTLEELLNLLVR